ncbi:MAG: hypothetical protein FWG11_00370, partial [Promicromonosporaceae bacterium]|nr:hypothetical protein [Promicromonosporaceae bacterium]
DDEAATGHRPGRKAGAVVLLVDGELTLFVERGGKSVLSFGGGDARSLARLRVAARELAGAAGSRRIGRVLITKVDGEPALTAARTRGGLAGALLDAGFAVTPRGLRVAGG